MVDTVVIPAAGLGIRLFTITKELPKEMVPIFYRTSKEMVLVKPLLEIIFENLFDSGFRNFCIIVSRGKEGIENHLNPHYDFIDLLKKRGEEEYAKIFLKLYKKIERSSIVWIRQYVQKGIGPATLLAKEVIGDRTFLFHAGDLYIPKYTHLREQIEMHRKLKPSATIGIKEVDNPWQYGVATLRRKENGVYEVIRVIEKPKNPPTNFALTGVDVFEPEIFDAIKKTKKSVNNEIQLTDSIQTLIKTNHTVLASKMNSKTICIDVGTPQNYFSALNYSYNHVY
ncbi:MAG: sugar phosphate nucleotidyltransferase [Nitrosopumilaceae archaeon]